MSDGKGFLAKCGFNKSALWGTPYLCAAGDGVRYLSESFNDARELLEDDEVRGSVQERFGIGGRVMISGELEAYMRFEGLEFMIAQVFGTAGAPAQQSTTDAYKHTFRPANSLAGIFGTLVFDKTVAVWEHQSVKLTGFTLASAVGDTKTKLTIRGIVRNVAYNTGAGVNKTSTIASITFPTPDEICAFNMLECWIGAAAGGAFDTTDLAYISSFEVNVDRQFPTDDITTEQAPYIDEPCQDGKLEVTGALNWSRYSDGSPSPNKALLEAINTKDKFKMELLFTGSVADAPYNNELGIWLPEIQFSEGGAPVGGASRIPADLSFRGVEAASAPTGFDQKDACYMVLQNTNTGDALAT